jgi:hypothetical protein
MPSGPPDISLCQTPSLKLSFSISWHHLSFHHHGMRPSVLLGALASSVYAQNQTYCTSEGGACYAVNVPASTAATGTGDIFFQISGPTSLSWIGLGQGSGMKGANIFIIYADATGTNVTLSARLGFGNQEPNPDTSANVTLLDGSGIMNDMMVANIQCEYWFVRKPTTINTVIGSNCNSWTGGSMSFTDADSDWIWAYKTGPPISSDDVDVTLAQHSDMGTTTFNLQEAACGSSADPFVSTDAASSSSGNSSSSDSSGGGGDDSMPADYNMVRFAHATLAPISFVLFFPSGAMAIRILSIKNLVYYHAGWMVFTYMIVLASLGMGVWMSVVSDQLDTTHAYVGIAVVGSLLFQPVTGLAHHLLYKRTLKKNVATYPHVWWGRAVITLGIINGGLGLQLSGNTTKGIIGYSVVAGVMWILWMVVIVIAFMKSRTKVTEGETGSDVYPYREKREDERYNNSGSFKNSPVRPSFTGSGQRPAHLV